MPIAKNINKDFFKKWTPEMAYVLGFFAADGYVTVNRRGGQFWCIQIADKELLYSIRKAIKSDHAISERAMRFNEQPLYRIQIGSIEMCNDLRTLGYSERKTKSLAIPNIPKKYFSAFVRGYFDGDGHVWTGYVHKERKNPLLAMRTVFTSCSKEFLSTLQSKLTDRGIIQGVLAEGTGNYYRLTYSIHNSLKLYDFMYNHDVRLKNTLFLKRKKDVFERFKKLRS